MGYSEEFVALNVDLELAEDDIWRLFQFLQGNRGRGTTWSNGIGIGDSHFHDLKLVDYNDGGPLPKKRLQSYSLAVYFAKSGANPTKPWQAYRVESGSWKGLSASVQLLRQAFVELGGTLDGFMRGEDGATYPVSAQPWATPVVYDEFQSPLRVRGVRAWLPSMTGQATGNWAKLEAQLIRKMDPTLDVVEQDRRIGGFFQKVTIPLVLASQGTKIAVLVNDDADRLHKDAEALLKILEKDRTDLCVTLISAKKPDASLLQRIASHNASRIKSTRAPSESLLSALARLTPNSTPAACAEACIAVGNERLLHDIAADLRCDQETLVKIAQWAAQNGCTGLLARVLSRADVPIPLAISGLVAMRNLANELAERATRPDLKSAQVQFYGLLLGMQGAPLDQLRPERSSAALPTPTWASDRAKFEAITKSLPGDVRALLALMPGVPEDLASSITPAEMGLLEPPVLTQVALNNPALNEDLVGRIAASLPPDVARPLYSHPNLPATKQREAVADEAGWQKLALNPRLTSEARTELIERIAASEKPPATKKELIEWTFRASTVDRNEVERALPSLAQRGLDSSLLHEKLAAAAASSLEIEACFALVASTESKETKSGLLRGLSKNPNLSGEQVDRWLDIAYGDPKPYGWGTFEIWSNPALARATRLDHRNVGLLARNPNAPNSQIRAAAEKMAHEWEARQSYDDMRKKESYGQLLSHSSWGEIPQELLITSFVPPKAASPLFATMQDRTRLIEERVLALELLLGWARETIRESNNIAPWLPIETPEELLRPFLESKRRSPETWNEGEERHEPGPSIYMEHSFGVPPRWPSLTQRLIAVYRSPSAPESLRREVKDALNKQLPDPPRWIKDAFFSEQALG